MSYQQKRDSLGELWIRLADHPIAFPAFYGSSPAYYIHDATTLHKAILDIAEAEDGIQYADKNKTKISKITSRMKSFYDFEIAQDGNSIALISYNWKMT